jgi:hypothetical protein
LEGTIISLYWAQKKETVSRKGMVTSNNYHGSEAGVRILKKGGNAVDAAVASAFADAVAYLESIERVQVETPDPYLDAAVAAVCHSVRERTGTDPMDALPEAWAACRAHIHAEVEGKRLMRLKVARIDGSSATYSETAIESFGKAFLLPLDCIIGWIAESCKEKKQRLFSMLAKTIVVKA